MAGVGPIVGDLLVGVVPHHVGSAARAGLREPAVCLGRIAQAEVLQRAERLDVAVHAPTVHVDQRGAGGVRSPGVVDVRVVVRRAAHTTGERIGHAHIERTIIVARDAVGTREGAEVVVEGPVLLHHEHQVVDVAEAQRRVDRRALRGRRRGGRGGGDRPSGLHRRVVVGAGRCGRGERQGERDHDEHAPESHSANGTRRIWGCPTRHPERGNRQPPLR